MARIKADTEALRAAAHECRVGAGQLAIAAECHREASRWEFAEDSLLAALETQHEAVAEMLQRRLEKASTVLTNSAHALAEAARKYDESNARTARLMETTEAEALAEVTGKAEVARLIGTETTS